MIKRSCCGSGHVMAQLLGNSCPLRLATETISLSDQDSSPCSWRNNIVGLRDSSPDKHVSSAFDSFPQLRRVHRSLDNDSAATLVHAFVTSRVDYCNAMYCQRHPSWPRPVSSSTSAAALTGCSSVSVVQALLNCPPVSAVQSFTLPDGVLHSAFRHYLSAAPPVCQLPPAVRIRRSMFGRRAFSVAGLMAWNLLSDTAHDPTYSFGSFWRNLRNFLSLLIIFIHHTTVEK